MGSARFGPDPTWRLVCCDRETVPDRDDILGMLKTRGRLGLFGDPRRGLVLAKQIARELGVKQNTVNAWARNGEIVARKIPDLVDGVTRHRWYVDRASLIARIEQMRRRG